jgi:hypothetical protein
MTSDTSRQSWNGKVMTPVHDATYGRPTTAYDGSRYPEADRANPPRTRPAGLSDGLPCSEERLQACIGHMENAARETARSILITILNVDIDDAGSVEAFQERRHREADLHRLIERALSDAFWTVVKLTAAILIAIAVLNLKEILAWFGRP